MNSMAHAMISVVLIGIGATLTFDLWGLLLKKSFNIPSSNICLVGRWLRYMPDGVFAHANIGATPRKNAECQVGWMAHYLIGVTFAGIFVAIMGSQWLEHPTPVPAIVFGIVTTLAPFLIMQPAFGFGIAASRSTNPAQARMRTLMNHAAFGIGLYFFGWLANWLS
jgi:hypothetical protein